MRGFHLPLGLVSYVGLPIIGYFYDEMVLSAKELSNDATKFSLPPSCRNLFLAYHRVCCETKGKSLVKLASWVSFWYKGSMKYAKPPKKSTKNKAHRPKDTHNPSKEIDHVKSCTQSEMKFFDNLGIAEADVKETYLAAFLACWLCKFVLPWGGVNLICPRVFKVASRMAQGETFSLVVRVSKHLQRLK